jgi:uncharacterized membrane protein
MKRARLILNIIAILLVVFQLIGYLGNMGKKTPELSGINSVAFFIGFNLPLIVAIFLFLISLFLTSKIRKRKKMEMVDSIGKA